jgi:Tol biopolymer transport system component
MNFGSRVSRRNRHLPRIISQFIPVVFLSVVSRTIEQAQAKPEKVYSISPASWWEDGWNRITISPDGHTAAYSRPWKGSGLIQVKTLQELAQKHAARLDKVLRAVYRTGHELVLLGVRGSEKGWFAEGENGLEPLPLSHDIIPTWSRDGHFLAFQKGEAGSSQLLVGTIEKQESYPVQGQITGITWSPDNQAIYAMTWQPNGESRLIRLERETGKTSIVAQGLDAAPWFNTIGISPDGNHLYLALASDDAPLNEARHQPNAPRNLRIHEIDRATGTRRVKVASTTDDFAPTVIGNELYWNRNEIHNAIVAVPSSGGEPRQIQDNAAMPRWRPDGKQISFVYGAWRLADWALNLDGGVIDVDDNLHPTSTMRPIVTGYHEDFTPAWSPDGQWIAYHSHRSPTPVPSYDGEGSTDDIYMRRYSPLSSEEIRLTDFGWEAGSADWSPDGRKIVFSSWEKGKAPQSSKPWTVTIDKDTGKPLNATRLPLPEPIHTTEELAWSPQGNEIAAIEATGEATRTIWIIDGEGSKSDKLVEYRSLAYGGLDWTPNGETIIYSGLSRDQMQLYAISRLGGPHRQVTHDPSNLLHPQVSPDGNWIACTRVEATKELWRLKL